MACFLFENNLKDDSASALQATATGVTYEAGPSGMALVMAPGAHTQVPNTAALDSVLLSVEVMVKPRVHPALGSRAGLIDYSVSIPSGCSRAASSRAAFAAPPIC